MSLLKPGVLYLAATPIGNVQDASMRLISAFNDADVIACEDTRKTKYLLQALNSSTSATLISHHEHNERDRISQILQMLRDGKKVLVVSDAGMPAVSDPGFPIVQAAIEQGFSIEVLPGPSAVTTALLLSGLPTDRFVFEGFLPRKSGERKKHLRGLINEQRTIVVFESGHRIADSLADIAEILGGDRKIALCREITKTYEEIIRATARELLERAQTEILGEITLVISGAKPIVASNEDVISELQRLAAAGVSKKEAISEVTTRLGVPKRDVFDAALSVSFDPVIGA